MKAHDLPRPYRWACPAEVVPSVDELSKQGYTAKVIAAALGMHFRTVYNILHRRGAYAAITKPN